MLSRSIFYKTFILLFIIWICFFLQQLEIIDSTKFSVYNKNDWYSIFTGVFLHANTSHIVGNTKALILSLPLLFYLYRKVSFEFILAGLFFPSYMCYAMGMNVIGISGLVFALVWFIIFAGIGSKDKDRFIASMIVGFFYANSLIGITPDAGYRIAWQAHLFGFVIAFIYAVGRYWKKDKKPLEITEE